MRLRSFVGAIAVLVPSASVTSLTNLQRRMVTGLLIAPIALAAALTHWGTWTALVVVAIGVAAYEWVRLVGTGERPNTLAGLLILLLMAVVATVILAGAAWALVGLAIMCACFVVAPHWLMARASARMVGWGAVYLGPSAIAVVWVHSAHDAGSVLICSFLALVWATDIGAYAAGRSIGGPRLWPRISPRKTWSGAIGGLLASLVCGLIFWMATRDTLHGMSIANTVAAALLVSVSAQAGDLLESAIKRRRGVKDSGGLLPGHGGVLDRLDGVFVAAPVFALLLSAAGDRLTWQ